MQLLLHAVLAVGLGSLAAAVVVTIDDAHPVPISDKFVSFGWEMWQMMSDLGDTPDLRYRTVASHLSPAVIRVGGITGDWVRYTEIPGAVPSPSNGFWPTAEANLSIPQFTQLLDFMKASNLTLLFMLNELHGRTCNFTNPSQPSWSAGTWCEGEWDTSNVRDFLQYLHDAGLVGGDGPLLNFELGNELVTHLDANTTVADIKRCADIIQEIWADVPASQRPGLFAPSTDDCGSADQLQIMANITGYPGVAGFTFHGYPGGSGQNPTLPELLLNVSWLQSGIRGSNSIQACIDAWDLGPRATGLQLLLTEGSSSWNSELPPPAQDAFVNAFFTIAELGQYALTGVGLVARWAFSEQSPFATIRHNSSTQRFDVASDYWLVLAHKAAVGKAAFPTTSDDANSGALVYAHCGKGGAGALAVTAVNPGTVAVPVSLALAGGRAVAAAPRLEWVFTGDIATQHPTLNGGASLVINPDGTLPATWAPRSVAAGGAGILLPPRSAAVFLLPDAAVAACQ